MKTNVVVNGIGVSLPSRKMEVKDFHELWDKEGIDKEVQGKATDLMLALGRETQYFFDPAKDEYFTLAERAIEDAMKEASLNMEEVDAIVFLSDTPEHTYPTNVLLLMDRLNGLRKDVYSFDMNSNCTGMLTAMDVMSRMLQSHPTMKNVLLVSVVVASVITSDKDAFTKPLFSDGASAVVLSKKEGVNRGFVDGVFRSEPTLVNGFRYPAIGMSKLQKQKLVEMEETKLLFNATDVSFFSDMWKEMTMELLDRNGLQVTDIKQCFFSQFAKPQGEETMTKIGIPLDKTLYIGGMYGYTGINSPVFAIHEAMKQERITKGDLVLVASVGAGYKMSTLLLRV